MILWHVYPVLTCMSRWGDAPVHSIAAALMLKRSQVHWFYDIGYFHNPWTHCPSEPSWLGVEKCSCDPSNSFGKYTSTLGFPIIEHDMIDRHWWSCTPEYLEVTGTTRQDYLIAQRNWDFNLFIPHTYSAYINTTLASSTTTIAVELMPPFRSSPPSEQSTVYPTCMIFVWIKHTTPRTYDLYQTENLSSWRCLFVSIRSDQILLYHHILSITINVTNGPIAAAPHSLEKDIEWYINKIWNQYSGYMLLNGTCDTLFYTCLRVSY